jgi:hypothetical protein
MVFNATVNNISWQSILLAEKTTDLPPLTNANRISQNISTIFHNEKQQKKIALTLMKLCDKVGK